MAWECSNSNFFQPKLVLGRLNLFSFDFRIVEGAELELDHPNLVCVHLLVAALTLIKIRTNFFEDKKLSNIEIILLTFPRPASVKIAQNQG